MAGEKKQKKGKKSSANTIRVAENVAKAMELRTAYHTFEAIGRQLGVSRAMAHRYVLQGQEELVKRTVKSAAVHREHEAERLSRLGLIANALLQRALGKQDEKGALAAVAELRKISESYRKLYGLDAPVKTEITGADGQPLGGVLLVPGPVPLEQWTEEVAKQQAALMAQKVEVIDA